MDSVLPQPSEPGVETSSLALDLGCGSARALSSDLEQQESRVSETMTSSFHMPLSHEGAGASPESPVLETLLGWRRAGRLEPPSGTEAPG